MRAGDSFVVTSHGTPVARIIPIADDGDRRAAAMADLHRHWTELGSEPIVVGPWTRDELYERDAADYPWRKA